MSHLHSTPTSSPNGVRRPFGELFEQAMRRLPTPVDNSQKEDFLKGKPSVFGTLDRMCDAVIGARASQEQYDEFCDTLHLAMLEKFPHRAGAPVGALADACAVDEAAEGVEDVAEIMAVAEPSASRLQSLYQRTLASLSAKRRMLRVIQRDFNRLVAR